MIRLTWDQFHHDCRLLADKILAAGNRYDKLMAVSRGGMFVGALLAYHLDLRNLTTIAIKLYDFNQPRPVVELLSNPDLPLPGSRILLVDDLLDSGRTLQYILDKWEMEYSFDIAVLYDKGIGHFTPHFFAKTMPDDWIWFPWEPENK